VFPWYAIPFQHTHHADLIQLTILPGWAYDMSMKHASNQPT
jgi:hypothetical protein